MASEFEELQLQVSFVDNASPQLKALLGEVSKMSDLTSRVSQGTREMSESTRRFGTELSQVSKLLTDITKLPIGSILGAGGIAGIAYGIKAMNDQLSVFSREMLNLQNNSRIAGILPDQFKSIASQLTQVGYSTQEANSTIISFFRTVDEAGRAGTAQFQKIYQEAWNPTVMIRHVQRLRDMIKSGEGAKALQEAAQEGQRIFERELTKPGGSRAEATRQQEAYFESIGLDSRAANIKSLQDIAGDPEKWQRRINAAMSFNREYEKFNETTADIGAEMKTTLLPAFEDLNNWLATTGTSWTKWIPEQLKVELGTIRQIVQLLSGDLKGLRGSTGGIQIAPGSIADTAIYGTGGQVQGPPTAFGQQPVDPTNPTGVQAPSDGTELTPDQAERLQRRYRGRTRQGGGPVGAGQPYIVGERGPEVFVPGSSGTVMANLGGGLESGEQKEVVEDEIDQRRQLTTNLKQINDLLEGGDLGPLSVRAGTGAGAGWGYGRAGVPGGGGGGGGGGGRTPGGATPSGTSGTPGVTSSPSMQWPSPTAGNVMPPGFGGTGPGIGGGGAVPWAGTVAPGGGGAYGGQPVATPPGWGPGGSGQPWSTPGGAPPTGTSGTPGVGPSGALSSYVAEVEKFNPSAFADYGQTNIGYGTSARGRTSITEPEARAEMNAELQKHYADIHGQFPNAPEGVKQALTSLSFNAGSNWRTGPSVNPDGTPTLKGLLEKGDYSAARSKFLEYNKAGGKRLEGLATRRQAEVSRFWDQKSQDASNPAAASANPPAVSTSPAGDIGPTGVPLPDQANRPGRYTGTLTVGDQSFRYVSGGGGRGSAPYGTFPVNVGDYSSIGSVASVGRGGGGGYLPDPKYPGAPRLGIQIHGTSGATLDQMNTAGCFGIPRTGGEWERAKAAILEMARKNPGGLVMTVGRDGQASIVPRDTVSQVVTNYPPGGAGHPPGAVPYIGPEGQAAATGAGGTVATAVAPTSNIRVAGPLPGRDAAEVDEGGDIASGKRGAPYFGGVAAGKGRGAGGTGIDRSSMDRMQGRSVFQHRVRGRGSVDVTINKSEGSRSTPITGPFKKIRMHGQRQNEPASSGPPEPTAADHDPGLDS